MSVGYEGEFENGSSFNGSVGSFEGGIFGPTGTSGDGGGGSPLFGGLVLTGGAYLAYRRFGNRSVPQLVADTASAASSAVGRLR